MNMGKNNSAGKIKQKGVRSSIFGYLAVFVLLISFSASLALATPAVNLGTAGNFVILSKSGISTTGTTSVTGDIGVSPIDSTAITGFGLILDPSTQFSTSPLVTGKIYAADYSTPTPNTMTTAISNMETAYNDAAGRTLPDYTELGAGNIGGMTLSPGLYKWGTGVTIPADVTLSGSSTDVWVFQIAQTLNISSGKQIILSGGAQAKNIFWQVAGQTTLGTTSVFNGTILDLKAIVLNTGATLNGRALSQTAVTLDADNVSAPIDGGTAPIPPTDTTPPAQNNNGNIDNNNETPICASFTYSNWSTCSANGTQTRTIVSSLPSGCINGSPVLTQTCTPATNPTNGTPNSGPMFPPGFVENQKVEAPGSGAMFPPGFVENQEIGVNTTPTGNNTTRAETTGFAGFFGLGAQGDPAITGLIAILIIALVAAAAIITKKKIDAERDRKQIEDEQKLQDEKRAKKGKERS